MKRILLPILVVALWLTTLQHSPAQENKAAAEQAAKPVAVLSISSYDQLLADAAMLGNLAGNPDLDKNIEEMLKLFTQNQGLAGLDRKRPWGITLVTDGIEFDPLVFLPVANYKQFLEALAPLIGEPQDIGKGVQGFSVFGFQVYAKNQAGWVFIAQSPYTLVSVPQDPTKLLGGLDKNYHVGARLYIQNIPEMYRALAVDQLRQGVEAGLGKSPDETEQQYLERKKMVEQQLASLTTTITEIDQITLGVAFDMNAKSALVDLTASAVAGSKTALQIVGNEPIATQFAGFLVPGAAASFNTASKIEKQDGDQITSALAAARSQAISAIAAQAKQGDGAAGKLAQEIVGEVFDAIQRTVESGKIDVGATLNLSDKAMTLVAGAYVADSAPLEAALKKFAKWAENEKDFPGIKFDAAKHGDVRFHTMSLPVPKEEMIAKIVGEKLDVAVGIGPKSIYLALGTDAINLTNQLIDKSQADGGKKLAPMQLNVALAPIFQFAAALHDQPEVRAIAAELANAKGKDGVSLTVTPDTKAAATTIRLEAQEAVLRVLISAISSAAGGDGGLPIGVK